MIEKAWAGMTGLAVVVAAYFFVVGGAIRSEPPTPAEGAVGLGLIAVGGGCALTAFVCLCTWMSIRNARIDRDQQPHAT